MRILLIGGNGFIGSPLARELQDGGHDVGIFHRGAGGELSGPQIRHIQGDRNRLVQHVDEIREFAPEVIVDLILSSGEQARALMRVARGIAGRVLAVSSMDVYRAWGVVHGTEQGGLEPLPIREDSALRTTRKVYSPETTKMLQSVFSWLDDGYDKIAVEEAVMSDSEVPGTVLRLPMVYGPGDPLHRFFPLVKRANDGRKAILYADDLGRWRGPRGFVENVAHAIALAATSERAAGRIYNICEEPALSELEWQTSIAKQMNWAGRFVVLPRERTPEHLLQPGNSAQHVVVSSQRIRNELGYSEKVTVEEGIRRTIAWETQNPPPMIDAQKFNYAAEDAALANFAA